MENTRFTIYRDIVEVSDKVPVENILDVAEERCTGDGRKAIAIMNDLEELREFMSKNFAKILDYPSNHLRQIILLNAIGETYDEDLEEWIENGDDWFADLDPADVEELTTKVNEEN